MTKHNHRHGATVVVIHRGRLLLEIYRAGRWPLSIYPSWLRYGLTFVIAMVVALAALLHFLCRRFRLLGLKRHSGASA